MAQAGIPASYSKAGSNGKNQGGRHTRGCEKCVSRGLLKFIRTNLRPRQKSAMMAGSAEKAQ